MQRRRKLRSGRVERTESIAALASPARQDIIDTIETLGGEATIAMLADQLGRPADGLYYHVKLLVRAGLLATAPGRSRAGRDERRYRLPVRAGEHLGLVYRPRDPRNAAAVRRVVRGMMGIARRDFDKALAAPGTSVAGSRRELWAARALGWVSDAELAEMNRLLERLSSLLRRPRRPSSRQLVSLVFVLAPVAARPRRR